MTSNEQRRTLPPLVHPAAAAVPGHKTPPQSTFRAEILPGNALARVYPRGPLDLVFFFVDTCFRDHVPHVCFAYIYLSEIVLFVWYKILTAVCQSLTAVPNYG